MQKAKNSERMRKPAGWVVHLLCVVTCGLPMVTQAQDESEEARATVEKSIEAARQKKARELAATLRAQTGLGPAVPAAAPAAPAPLAASALDPAAASPNPPRIWSLTSRGAKVWVEVLFDGRIYALESGQHQPTLGPWTLVSMSSEEVTLVRRADIARGHGSAVNKGDSRLVLRPPSRGSSVTAYSFDSLSGLGDWSLLSPSVQRAAQLPLPPGR
jgi:hypothetical protein